MEKQGQIIKENLTKKQSIKVRDAILEGIKEALKK